MGNKFSKEESQSKLKLFKFKINQNIADQEKESLQKEFKEKVAYWESLNWQVPSNIWNDIRMDSKYGFELFQKFLMENKQIVIQANGKRFHIVNEFQKVFNDLVDQYGLRGGQNFNSKRLKTELMTNKNAFEEKLFENFYQQLQNQINSNGFFVFITNKKKSIIIVVVSIFGVSTPIIIYEQVHQERRLLMDSYQYGVFLLPDFTSPFENKNTQNVDIHFDSYNENLQDILRSFITLQNSGPNLRYQINSPSLDLNQYEIIKMLKEITSIPIQKWDQDVLEFYQSFMLKMKKSKSSTKQPRRLFRKRYGLKLKRYIDFISQFYFEWKNKYLQYI